jgi:hypothetical protein
MTEIYNHDDIIDLNLKHDIIKPAGKSVRIVNGKPISSRLDQAQVDNNDSDAISLAMVREILSTINNLKRA